MNKLTRLLLFGLIVASFLGLIHSYFHQGIPYTHDGENHLARFANYKIALKEGQFPPRWAPNLMNRYGYPVFNYNYPLANMLSLFGSVVKLNYELTFKIIVGLAVLAGGSGLLLWLRQILPKSNLVPQIIAITAWITSVYLINLINFRGNIGEILAYCLFPWMLWIIENISNKNVIDLKKLVIWIIVGSLFLLSHNIAVVFSLPILIVYAITRLDTKKQLGLWVFSLLGSVLLSLWFWLPALAEKSFVLVDSSTASQDFANHFPMINQLLFSPIEFGFSYRGFVDSLSFQVGWPFIVVLLLIGPVFILESPKNEEHKTKYLLATSTLLLILLIVFQLTMTESIWQMFPVARYIQFPWRLSLFIPTITAPLIVYVWQLSGKTIRTIVGLVILISVLTAWRVKPVDYFHKLNRDYDAFAQSTSTENENLTPEFRFDQSAAWRSEVSTIDGVAEIDISKWSGSQHNYIVRTQDRITIVEPTMMFPGWITTATNQNGDKFDVSNINSDQIAGRLAYQLDPGEYQIESRFTQHTWARMVGNYVTLLVALSLVVAIGYEFKTKPAKN